MIKSSAEAREIIDFEKCRKPGESAKGELGYAEACGYLEALSGPEWTERERIMKGLVEVLEHADKRFVDMNFEEIGFNTLGRIRQALEAYKESLHDR